MSKHPTAAGDPLAFTPVAVRARRDGWTPQRQIGFIQALAATGCVDEAARHVGMTARSARDLRTRRDAASFRAAWEAAVAMGIRTLAEAALSRAIHGVPVPIFYKGEQVGERRRYDERITAYLLRYYDGRRFGAWRDKFVVHDHHPDATAMLFHEAVKRLAGDCVADQLGVARQRHKPLIFERREEGDVSSEARDEAARRELREMELTAERDRLARELSELQARVAGSSAATESSDAPGSSAPR